MRFLKRLFKQPIKTIVQTAKVAIKDPVRASLAVVTTGGSEIARTIPGVGKIVAQGTTLASGIYSAAANVYTGGLYGAASGLASSIISKGERKGESMAINLGSFMGGLGKSSNPFLAGIGQLTPFVTTALAKRPMVPAIPAPRPPIVVRPAGTVARGFFNKFPNLAVAMQQLRDRGQKVKRSQLYAMLKRFGPEVLITGGLLTAAAVNELMVAGAGHRRMNPGNAKALGRSMRRLESFHKLCQRADKLRRPRAKCKTAKKC